MERGRQPACLHMVRIGSISLCNGLLYTVSLVLQVMLTPEAHPIENWRSG